MVRVRVEVRVSVSLTRGARHCPLSCPLRRRRGALATWISRGGSGGALMPARSRRFLTTPRHEHAGDYSGGELQLVLRSGAVPAFPACACGPQLRRPQPCRPQPASKAPTFAGARRPRLRGGRGLLPGCLFAPSRAPPAHRHPPQPRLVGQRQGTQPPDLKGGGRLW